jgi:hypothetical protein
MPFPPLISRAIEGMLTALGSTIKKSTTPSGWITYAGSLDAASKTEKLFWASKPANDPTNGLVIVELQPHIRVALQFAGYDSVDPNDMTATLRGWLVSEHEIRAPSDGEGSKSEGHGVHAFDATVVIGNTTIPATSGLHPGGTNVCKWADTITVTADKTKGGIDVTGDTTECAAEMTFDSASRRFLAIQISCDANIDGFRLISRQY